MMGIFYTAAGFWKLNSSFLDTRVSCAPILAASLATRLPEWLLSPALVNAALALSPHLTILFELGPGVCLLLPFRIAHRTGVVLVVLLHYAIALTPFPNAISQFGVVCITRMFFVLPEAYTAALAECFALPSSASGVVARVAAGAFVAYTAACTDSPGLTIDWGLPTCALLGVIALRAVAIDAGLMTPAARRKHGAGTSPTSQRHGSAAARGSTRAWLLRIGGAAALFVALLYSFGAHMLGLMDMSTVSPFSNLRKPRSNHLFAPTALLQRWPATAEWDLFGGGVVRVTACSSDFLNALYPASGAAALPARARALLHQAKHVGLQTRATPARILGRKIRAFMPRWRPGELFTAYTLPALELRRMLAEVRAVNESFTMEYERLPGLEGDETWRQTAVARRVRLKEDGRGGRTCESVTAAPSVELQGASAGGWAPCAADELARLPAPEGPLMRLLVFHPYLLVPGEDELPCYS